jgi:hypothetical protein
MYIVTQKNCSKINYARAALGSCKSIVQFGRSSSLFRAKQSYVRRVARHIEKTKAVSKKVTSIPFHSIPFLFIDARKRSESYTFLYCCSTLPGAGGFYTINFKVRKKHCFYGPNRFIVPILV